MNIKDISRRARVLAHLDELESAQALGASSRRYRMLRYLVTHELDGTGEQIKAYAIGVDVLDRGTGFNPSVDSIVRVEAARLRDALDLCYGKEGARYPVRIQIPKGTYRPVIEVTPQVPEEEAPQDAEQQRELSRRAWWRVGLLAVPVLTVISASALSTLPWQPPEETLAEASDRPRVLFVSEAPGDAATGTLEILSRFRNLALIVAEEPAGRGVADYRLDLSGAAAGRVTLTATALPSGEIVATRQFARSELAPVPGTTDPDFAADDGTVSALAGWIGQVAGRDGLIENDYERRGNFGPDYACAVAAEAYYLRQTDARHLAARNCIEARLAAGADSSLLYTSLAMLHREEDSDRRNPLPGDPLDRAVEAAWHAIQLDPSDAGVHYMLMTVLLAAGNETDALAAGERALALNPYDGSLVSGFASRLSYFGQYERALELLDRSRALSSGGARWLSYGYFLAHFGRGDRQRAAEVALTLIGTENPLYLAALAIGHSARGEREGAGRAMRALLAAEPDPRAMYERRNYDPALVDALVRALDGVAPV